MSDTKNLRLLLKRCNELGYSLIEVVGEAEAAKIYGLAATKDTKKLN